MIGSTGLGKGFGGLARYLFHGHEGQDPNRAAWTAVRNLAIQDPELAPRVMRATAEQNARVKTPVYHLSLSASPGESLTREQWEEAADRVLKSLGLTEHQALLVAHRDTAHEHIHLMVNRVHPERLKVWKPSHDFPKIERPLRQIEREWGLREVPGRHHQLDGQEQPRRSRGSTEGERRQADRTGTEPWAERVRAQVRGDFKKAKSWADLEHRLQEKGLHLRRRGQGLVVTDGTHLVKASRIHRSGSYRRLGERYGMSFEEWRQVRAELRQKAAEFERHERLRRGLQDREGKYLKVLGSARSLEETELSLRIKVARELQWIRHQPSAIFRKRDVPGALHRMNEIGRQHGWGAVGKLLRHEPERLGRLRGARLGRWGTDQRIYALQRAEAVARAAAGVGRLRNELDSVRHRLQRSAPLVVRAKARLARASKVLAMMPQRAAQELALAKLAARLGVRTAKLVLPKPLALPVVGAVKLASRLLGSVRDQERGRGR